MGSRDAKRKRGPSGGRVQRSLWNGGSGSGRCQRVKRI